MASIRTPRAEQAAVDPPQIAEPRSFGRSSGCPFQIATLRQSPAAVSGPFIAPEQALCLRGIAPLEDPVVQQMMSRTEH